MLDRLAAGSGLASQDRPVRAARGAYFWWKIFIPGARLRNWVVARARQEHCGPGPPRPADSDQIGRPPDRHPRDGAQHGPGVAGLQPEQSHGDADEEFRIIDLECVTQPGARVPRHYTVGFAGAGAGRGAVFRSGARPGGRPLQPRGYPVLPPHRRYADLPRRGPAAARSGRQAGGAHLVHGGR